MSSIQIGEIPGTAPGRSNTAWSNLLTLALMYPEIRRKMQRERELRQLREGLLGQMDVAQGAGAEATPGWLEGLGRTGYQPVPQGRAAPALPAVATANPVALPAGPQMGMGGLLTGLGGGTQPAGTPEEITARLLASLPATPRPEAALPAGGAGGWLPLGRAGAMQMSAPAGRTGYQPVPQDLNALPLADPRAGGGGLDALFRSDQWRGPALKAAMLGESGWLGMKPRGFEATAEQQGEAYQWGEMGGKERFTQEQLGERARAGIAARLQIAGDKLGADQARAAQATRSREAGQHYRNAVSLRTQAQNNWRQAAEGAEPGWAERAAEFDREADEETARGDWLEMNAPAATGAPVAPEAVATGQPAGAGTAPAWPEGRRTGYQPVPQGAAVGRPGGFAPASASHPVAGPGGLPPLYDADGQPRRPTVKVPPGGRMLRRQEGALKKAGVEHGFRSDEIAQRGEEARKTKGTPGGGGGKKKGMTDAQARKLANEITVYYDIANGITLVEDKSRKSSTGKARKKSRGKVVSLRSTLTPEQFAANARDAGNAFDQLAAGGRIELLPAGYRVRPGGSPPGGATTSAARATGPATSQGMALKQELLDGGPTAFVANHRGTYSDASLDSMMAAAGVSAALRKRLLT